MHPEELFIKNKNSIELYINKLKLLNPLNVLSKGYSLVNDNGNLVKSINDVKINDELNIRVLDGYIISNVKGVDKK